MAAALLLALAMVACSGSESEETPGNGALPSDAAVAETKSDSSPSASDASQDGTSGDVIAAESSLDTGAVAHDASTDGDGAAATLSDVAGSSGGLVGDKAGNVTLDIPPGALLGETHFTFTPLESLSNLPADYVLVAGTAYQIDWTGAGFVAGKSVTLHIRKQRLIMRVSDGSGHLHGPPPTPTAIECNGGYVQYSTTTSSDSYDTNAPLGCPVDVGGGTPPGPGSTQVGVTAPAPDTYPTITTQPQNGRVGAGTLATFSVAATGTALTYQWRKDGVDIPGAKYATYIFATRIGDNGAKYSVVVSNHLGSVTSEDAVLTVDPPPPPSWATPQSISGAPVAGIDLPQVGSSIYGLLVVWDDGNVLHAGGYAATRGDSPFAGFAPPSKRRPKVVWDPSFATGYIVFVDDDGTGNCPSGGNRLSAIAWTRDLDIGLNRPLSSRFTLYQSAGDCINEFSAGLGESHGESYAPDGGPVTMPRVSVVFALSEATALQIKVGTGETSFVAPSSGTSAGSWSPPATALATISRDTACLDPVWLGNRPSVFGARQAHAMGGSGEAKTTATVTWTTTNGNLCATTLESGTWTQASSLLDKVTEPVMTMDRAGNVLIVVSRPVARDAGTRYEFTAVSRAAAGGAWTTQVLDESNGPTYPSAAFSGTGSALVVWGPLEADIHAPVVKAGVRSPEGTWDPIAVLSAPDTKDAQYFRVCADPDGNAVALFIQKSDLAQPFQAWSRQYLGGAWSALAKVQNDNNEAIAADCPRQIPRLLSAPPFAAWRETDPSDATKFRIMTSN